MYTTQETAIMPTENKDKEQSTTTASKPQPPAPPEKAKAPLPEKVIPDFPGDSETGNISNDQ